MKTRLLVVLSAAMLVGALTAHAAEGRSIFLANCTPCHGEDGKGRTPQGKKLHAKDLTASKLADAEVEKQIVAGSKDRSGNSRMPSFKTTLTADEITALIAYLKTLRR
ncbi:MAG TPA: cytochrome c [Lacunisphaera sp.]|jgi:mono/diheme cytochrome c family protein|nr:cytochrome c [Lacunisphaera sp.]